MVIPDWIKDFLAAASAIATVVVALAAGASWAASRFLQARLAKTIESIKLESEKQLEGIRRDSQKQLEAFKLIYGRNFEVFQQLHIALSDLHLRVRFMAATSTVEGFRSHPIAQKFLVDGATEVRDANSRLNSILKANWTYLREEIATMIRDFSNIASDVEDEFFDPFGHRQELDLGKVLDKLGELAMNELDELRTSIEREMRRDLGT